MTVTTDKADKAEYTVSRVDAMFDCPNSQQDECYDGVWVNDLGEHMASIKGDSILWAQ